VPPIPVAVALTVESLVICVSPASDSTSTPEAQV
jgi:hypothetical protein